MTSKSRRRWTIRFVRADGRRAHTLSTGRAGMVAGATGVAGVILISGMFLGRTLASRAESEEVAALSQELRAVRFEAREVSRLSRRLEGIEGAYARLQAAVTEGAPTFGPSVALPAELSGAAGAEALSTAPVWPVAQRGFITRTFGSRAEASADGHPGIDIAVPSGSYVRTMRRGIVDDAGEDEVYGRFVRIAHGDGLTSLYGHNSWVFVQPGDSVERFEVIALSGNTGRSTAPHLHFEITRDGELLDPLAFVNHGGREVVGGVGQSDVEQR